VEKHDHGRTLASGGDGVEDEAVAPELEWLERGRCDGGAQRIEWVGSAAVDGNPPEARSDGAGRQSPPS
jgi:hypothetical protein